MRSPLRCNSVHQITKDTTGQPQVFRVLAVSGTTVTISPKILPVENTDVASRPYANVDAKPQNQQQSPFSTRTQHLLTSSGLMVLLS